MSFNPSWFQKYDDIKMPAVNGLLHSFSLQRISGVWEMQQVRMIRYGLWQASAAEPWPKMKFKATKLRNHCTKGLINNTLSFRAPWCAETDQTEAPISTERAQNELLHLLSNFTAQHPKPAPGNPNRNGLFSFLPCLPCTAEISCTITMGTSKTPRGKLHKTKRRGRQITQNFYEANFKLCRNSFISVYNVQVKGERESCMLIWRHNGTRRHKD